MPLTISRKQRDAIYELVVDHLSAIGDVWVEFEKRDFVTAKRQAGEFVQGLRLLTDLGWDETIETEEITLTVPRDELVATLAWLHRLEVWVLDEVASGAALHRLTGVQHDRYQRSPPRSRRASRPRTRAVAPLPRHPSSHATVQCAGRAGRAVMQWTFRGCSRGRPDHFASASR